MLARSDCQLMNPMSPMGLAPFNLGPPAWVPSPPLLPPMAPVSTTFWNSPNVCSHLRELHDTINFARAIQKELEVLILMKEKEATTGGEDKGQGSNLIARFSNLMDNLTEFKFQQSLSLDAANAIMAKLRFQLEPFRVVTDENTPWEEKSAVKRLVDKMQKYKRNKLWRRRKRKRMAENLSRDHKQFDKKDKEADEWRAREIANDIAKQKVEKMKGIAKHKAKEEKKRLESELELVLIVEKLQELRSMRILKMKKQGCFLPEEDDRFLELVRAAVEEEENQALAATDTNAAKYAIANAEGVRKQTDQDSDIQDQQNDTANENVPKVVANEETGKLKPSGPGYGSAYDSVANLPMEFYHYYHGSNTDLGTLIEVRRTWDMYIRPGGSRIPGHWVQPPSPADDIWASYLVKPE